MVDITLALMKSTGRDDGEGARIGDIERVYLRSEVAAAPAEGNGFVYIHVTDVPPAIAEKIQVAVAARDEIVDAETGDQIGFARRKWFIPFDSAPAATMDLLRTRRYLTADWETIKPYVRRRLAQAEVMTDEVAQAEPARVEKR